MSVPPIGDRAGRNRLFRPLRRAFRDGIPFLFGALREQEDDFRLTANSIKYDSLYNWTLIDYMIRDFDGMREHITEGSRMDTTLTIVPSDFLISVNDCETMTSSELSTYIDRQKKRGIGNRSNTTNVLPPSWPPSS